MLGVSQCSDDLAVKSRSIYSMFTTLLCQDGQVHSSQTCKPFVCLSADLLLIADNFLPIKNHSSRNGLLALSFSPWLLIAILSHLPRHMPCFLLLARHSPFHDPLFQLSFPLGVCHWNTEDVNDNKWMPLTTVSLLHPWFIQTPPLYLPHSHSHPVSLALKTCKYQAKIYNQ